MGILDKARQATEQAAAATRQAGGEALRRAEGAAAQLSDPTTQEKAKHTLDMAGKQAKVGLGHAKRGVSTVIDRIDPNILAEVVIKATSLQEKANAALRAKGSPYRVAEIAIAASIPPQITFSIGRIDDPEPVPVGELVESTALIDAGIAGGTEVVALDGSTEIDLPVENGDDASAMASPDQPTGELVAVPMASLVVEEA
jgi:hypothetical protein